MRFPICHGGGCQGPEITGSSFGPLLEEKKITLARARKESILYSFLLFFFIKWAVTKGRTSGDK